MLILIIVISLVLGLICSYLFSKNDENFVAAVLGFLSVCILILAGFILFIMLLCYPYKVDEKIVMYQEENTIIEEKVKNTVRAYMEFEQETYDKLLKDADLITMMLKYPELNSNELVKIEIETYKENSQKIKELKDNKIGRSTMAWWICFGN